jgi:bloom syndrome protein
VLVESFVDEGSRKAKEIMINKGLRKVPFSNTTLRHMAIHFTETLEEMLRIPGIDPDKVQHYGQPFCKMVKETHRSYNDEMAQREDAPDPNAQNVIDLVSDDEDEYGSFSEPDMEEDEDEGEPSAYFQFEPPQEVREFNARFAQSQSAALRAASASQPAKKAYGKPKKRNYRPTGSTNTGNRSRFSGGSRSSSNAYSGAGGGSRAANKTGSRKRSNNGGGRGGHAAGASTSAARRPPTTARSGGISMMPT